VAKSDDVLLDLSEWSREGGRRTTLPPRPSGRRRLPVPLTGVAVALAAVGLGLLVVPLPGTGCGSPLSVWADAPLAAPSDTPPDLDDGQVAADAEAVRRAQLALSAPARSAPVVRTTPVPVTRTVVRPGSAAAAARVPELEDAVARDEQDVASAKRARDDVVEQQQASDDPNAYDAEVAAAQEELDAALARLAGDESALARARHEARSTRVTVATTSPSPLGVVAPASGAGPSREERAEALSAARRTQAAHLAARREALAGWTSSRAAEAARVTEANAALRSCEGTVRLPAALGGLALLGAAGAAARVRLRG